MSKQPEFYWMQVSDYDDFYIATREEAEEQIATAEELLKLVESHCEKRLGIKC